MKIVFFLISIIIGLQVSAGELSEKCNSIVRVEAVSSIIQALYETTWRSELESPKHCAKEVEELKNGSSIYAIQNMSDCALKASKEAILLMEMSDKQSMFCKELSDKGL